MNPLEKLKRNELIFVYDEKEFIGFEFIKNHQTYSKKTVDK